MGTNNLFSAKGTKVEVRRVKKSYQTGVTAVPALKNVNMDLEGRSCGP